MTKVAIQDLTDEQLVEFTARAQGYSRYYDNNGSDRDFWEYDDGVVKTIWCDEYNPLDNDAQAMALVKEFKLAVWFYNGGGVGPWHCCESFKNEVHFTDSIFPDDDIQSAENANRAICLAVVASKYGNEVEME